ncbi:MAG: DUF3298 domain-containing protein [Clostridiales bacterium]|nr:DUF3298 domain-containing protein [Clostridiales bacterium]
MNKKYDDIIIPKELEVMINNTIKKEKNKKKLWTSLATTAAALIIFTTSLNVSPAFAESLKDIPVIKNIAAVLTFTSYETESDELFGEITVPEVIIEDTNLDEFINETIQSQVSIVLEEAQINAEGYKEAYLATGGTEEGYENKNMTVSVDYEIFTQDEEYLSFRVYSHESLAAVYASNLYFTVDLKEKRLLTLEDLLGNDYINIMTTTVLEAIEKDAKDNPNKYFDDYKTPEFKVRGDIDFYLTTDHKLMIVFQKYELAPGAMGRLEFEIPMN